MIPFSLLLSSSLALLRPTRASPFSSGTRLVAYRRRAVLQRAVIPSHISRLRCFIRRPLEAEESAFQPSLYSQHPFRRRFSGSPTLVPSLLLQPDRPLRTCSALTAAARTRLPERSSSSDAWICWLIIVSTPLLGIRHPVSSFYQRHYSCYHCFV